MPVLICCLKTFVCRFVSLLHWLNALESLSAVSVSHNGNSATASGAGESLFYVCCHLLAKPIHVLQLRNSVCSHQMQNSQFILHTLHTPMASSLHRNQQQQQHRINQL